MFDSILLHGRFANLNTEFAEFTDDPWNTPANVGAGEFPDQILNLFGDRWTAWSSTVTQGCSIVTEAFTLPGNDSRRLN